MKRDIPSQSRRVLQDNKNQFNGNIAESFNLDLVSNRGKIGVTRAKKISDFQTSFGGTTRPIMGISSGTFGLFFTGVETALDSVFEGGETAFSSTFVRDASSFDIGLDEGDLLVVNDKIYITGSQSFAYTTMNTFGTWTDVSSPALTDNTPHLLTSLGNNVYVTNDYNKVGVIDSSNTLSLTGTSTLDLDVDGYVITVFMSGLDRVWIGVSGRGNRVANGTCYMYEWDGESENQPSQKYEIDASGLICGVVKDGIPYVLDTNGRLLRYAGSSFVEVARLPYKKGEFMAGYDSSTIGGVARAINPRSITVDGDEILINVSNRLEDNYWADFPSGVWAYSEENGLYHKLSASYQAVADTGTTNMQDHGQMRVAQAGAIFVHNPTQASFYDSGEGGRILFSQQYFNSADDNVNYVTASDVTLMTGLFADDTQNNTQKYGYFITPELHTDDIEDTWQKVYLKHKQLLDSADKIVVKYREEVKPKVTTDITWLDIDRFTTTTDVSAFTQNQEVQIVQGFGSGKSFTISSISEDAGTYTVVLTETVNVLCYGKTAVAQFSNFLNVGETNYNDRSRIRSITIPNNNTSPMAQFKVCMQFTGEDELYGVKIISKSNIKE